MNIQVSLLGDGSNSSPYRPELPFELLEGWQDNGDGTATVTLTDAALQKAETYASIAAVALNGTNEWPNIQSRFGSNSLFPALKIWLVAGAGGADPVKDTFTSYGTPVPQGHYLAHNEALWKSNTQTSAEPSESSGDWSLVFAL